MQIDIFAIVWRSPEMFSNLKTGRLFSKQDSVSPNTSLFLQSSPFIGRTQHFTNILTFLRRPSFPEAIQYIPNHSGTFTVNLAFPTLLWSSRLGYMIFTRGGEWYNFVISVRCGWHVLSDVSVLVMFFFVSLSFFWPYLSGLALVNGSSTSVGNLSFGSFFCNVHTSGSGERFHWMFEGWFSWLFTV